MNIINFKLINGDEIIAKLITTAADYIIVDKPRSLQFNAGGTGAAFVPALMMSNDGEVKVYKTAISMYNDNVGSEYEKHYMQSVTGIQLATSLQG